MKRDQGILLAISILVALCIGPIVVSGHALVIDYRIDSIGVEAYYGGMEPTPVQYADAEVFYPDGRLASILLLLTRTLSALKRKGPLRHIGAARGTHLEVTGK